MPCQHKRLAGTVTVNDSLDLLAEFMGCGDLVAEVTNKVRRHAGLSQQQFHSSSSVTSSKATAVELHACTRLLLSCCLSCT